MFSFLSALLNRQDRSESLPDVKPQEAVESFSRFFQDKIEKIGQGFVDEPSEKSEGKNALVLMIFVRTRSLAFVLFLETTSPKLFKHQN